ncbi:MAG: hypothetical protein WCP60_02910 [bacterium]
MHRLRSVFVLVFTLLLPLLLGGCAVPGAPYNGNVPNRVVFNPGPPPPAPYYGPTYGMPSVVIAPTFYPGYGYGYWHRGQYCAYRNGYYFGNGCYYRGGPRYYNNGRWCGPNNYQVNWNRNNYYGGNYRNNGNWQRGNCW